tara:strand:+ start:419 stop:1576 length:1158 start_codon:yes stop_codon:yes gene_type:complete
MFNKDFVFKNYFLKVKKTSKNLKKTNNFFKLLKTDIKNFKIPLLQSFENDFEMDFSADTVKKFSGCQNIVVIGMGGSILGTKAIYSFLKSRIKKKLFFFDNLDSCLHYNFKKLINYKNTCFLAVSKSGDTLETITNLNLIASKISLKNKLIIISEIKDSSLIKYANKLSAEVIEHKNFIGGRYSVLSEVGMFPAALMNLKIASFKNLSKLINNKFFTSSLIGNVSCMHTLYERGFKNSVILNYDTGLNDLCLWYQQLMAESLGKKGKGILPVISSCPKDHHSLLQLYLDGPKDKFFTFFSSFSDKNKKINTTTKAQCEATKNIFKKKNIPYREFIFKKNNESELGSIFTFLVLETILLSHLMNINPYDQPAIEQIKIETKKILSR